MSLGRTPYYLWSGEGLHIWSDHTPADQEPLVASAHTYNEGDGSHWDPQEVHAVILPYAVARQLLTHWLRDRHPDLATPALLAAIAEDFADDPDGGTRGTLIRDEETQDRALLPTARRADSVRGRWMIPRF